MSKRKRILICAAASVVGLTIYGCFFGVQTGLAFVAWRWGRQIPLTKLTPIELSDYSISAEPGTKLSYFGYSFEVPWTDIEESKSKGAKNLTLLHSRSGISLLFGSSSPKSFVSYIASQTGGDSVLGANFGDATVSSDYNFYRAMLNTTPATVSPFTSRQVAARASMLLMIKAIVVPGSSAIFSFQTSHFRGFQFGNPSAKSKSVSIRAFDDFGKVEITLECGTNCSGNPITQADVNRIAQSLARVAPVIEASPVLAAGNSKLTSSR